jgi:hypothetical protein
LHLSRFVRSAFEDPRARDAPVVKLYILSAALPMALGLSSPRRLQDCANRFSLKSF